MRLTLTQLFMLVACHLLSLPAGAEVPPAPTYRIGDQNIGIGGGSFAGPEQAKGFIEATWLDIPWAITVLCGAGQCPSSMHCPATAAVVRQSDVHEQVPLNFWSAPTAKFPIVTSDPRCTAVDQFNRCTSWACQPSAYPYNYTMHGVCPSPTLVFREAPNRCECSAPNQTWHPETGSCQPVIDIDLSKSTPRSCPKGNPVYPMTGVKTETLSLGVEIGGITLTLSYASTSDLPRATADYTSKPQGMVAFGPMWSGNLHRYLLTPYMVDVSRGVVAVRGNGREQAFVPDAAGALRSADPGNANGLLGSAYVDRSAFTVDTFWAGGALQAPLRVNPARGGQLDFGYAQVLGGPEVFGVVGPYLVRVSDHFGRTVRFEYGLDASSGQPRVQRILRPDGQVIALGYQAGMLASVQWPDMSSTQFLYEHASNPRLLTGRIDEAGLRAGTYQYDDSGVAKVTSGAGGVNAFTMTHAASPRVDVTEQWDPQRRVIYRTRVLVPPPWVAVTDALGAQVVMTPAAATGDAVAAWSQPAGAGCDAATSSAVYDARGNTIQRDDFVGNRTCQSHDALNRERVRVEGLQGGSTGAACDAVVVDGASLPVGSRKRTTEWHPVWNLPVRSAEPGVLTTFVYNGSPDAFNGGAIASCSPAPALPAGLGVPPVLCREVRQATLDTTGEQGLHPTLQVDVPARVRQLNYNEFGQVLSAKDSSGNATSYAYYATNSADYRRGDLASITNAAGHVTRHTRYNADGRVLESIDPNGIPTQYTYDLRGRLTSVSVDGRTTAYSYTPTGNLSSITEPDGSFTQFTYDAAHRLVSIRDAGGNRIEYTLDAAGNRTDERFLDPAGGLRNRVTRAFDVLGRIQSLSSKE